MDETKPTPPPTEAGQCRYLKPDGSRCKTNTRQGSEFCFFHDPECAAERHAAQIAGGKERSRRAAVLLPDTPDRPLRDAADVRAFLAESINQVRRGQLDPHVANAVGYLAQVLLKAADQHALEQRLARLESVFAVQQESTKQNPGVSFEFVNSASEKQS